ncbi:hypothetical protein TGRUB_433920 [Toxoplasma gondii RUB]|uniref:Uncharacterized protein n=1 Tax=Toxoplasma gondii RUB TaxID=935652 RepID=A0A086LJ49_TOXGO|nr:hypothetical protein TGRUB_433920 [Toxoplasma gondii RUB]
MWEGPPETPGGGPCIPDCLEMQRSIPNPSGIPTEDENAVAAVCRIWRIWYVGGGATAAPSSLLIAQPEEPAPGGSRHTPYHSDSLNDGSGVAAVSGGDAALRLRSS